jgi:hypothetical protein
MVVKIQVIFWVVMPRSVAVHPEDGGIKVLQNTSSLPQHYTV